MPNASHYRGFGENDSSHPLWTPENPSTNNIHFDRVIDELEAEGGSHATVV